MDLSVHPHPLILLISGIATISISLVIYRRLKPTERSFSLVLGLAGWWALGSAGEHLSLSYTTMLFWLRFQYVSICFLPPALIVFIRVFVSNRKMLLRASDALIFAIPVITFFIVCTNDYHHFYFKSLTASHYRGLPVLKIERSFWYYLFTAYWYLVMVWCVFLLATAFKRADKIYQKQKRIVIYALVVPWLVNIFYKLGISPAQNLDFTPFAFIITGLIISFGLLRFKLFDVIPAARERVFESMHDGVLVLDTSERVIDNNVRMGEILPDLHQRNAEITLAELFPMNESLLLAVSKRIKTSVEIGISLHGAERYYEVDINTLSDKTGEYSGCFLIFNNITGRKISALTLSTLNELKDKIFSIISHDLRSPLSNLKSMIELIDDKVITEEEFRNFLPALSKNLNYTSGLLDNLLHWSKSQLKGETMQRSVIDIRTIVEQEIFYYQSQATEKGIELHHTIKDETLVYMHLEMLRLIVRNLIGNAIKFCGNNDYILVSSAPVSPHEVVICVKDTGIGMKPETTTGLFADTFTIRGTNDEQGTGLGLQFCKDFVEKNGGRIWVTSEWGKGSEFYFTAPKPTLKNSPVQASTVFGINN